LPASAADLRRFVVAGSLSEWAGAAACRRVAAAVGVFDGVHRGHRRILESLLRTAARHGAAPVAMTFSPHPRAVLAGPEAAPRLLTPRPYQLHLFRSIGLAGAVVVPFTSEFAALSPEAFVDAYLLSPNVEFCAVCVGRDWRFGAGGAGDAALLSRMGGEAGFETVAVPPMLWYGKPVSSTRVRRAVAAGKIDSARRMLGRPFTLAGPVVHGYHLGETLLQCPTANLDCSDMQFPPSGVYAAFARYGDLDGAVYLPESEWRPAAVYIGAAPTLRKSAGMDEITVEVHFLAPVPSLYVRYVEAALIEFVRPDRAFPTVDALRRRIDEDVARVQSICARTPHLPA